MQDEELDGKRYEKFNKNRSKRAKHMNLIEARGCFGVASTPPSPSLECGVSVCNSNMLKEY